MHIKWTSSSVVENLPGELADDDTLLRCGLAPLIEQQGRWELTMIDAERCEKQEEEEAGATGPCLEGNTIIMYHNVTRGYGRASVAVNVCMDRVLSLMEMGETKNTRRHWHTPLREHVENGGFITLIVFEWPNGTPVTQHTVRQVYTLR